MTMSRKCRLGVLNRHLEWGLAGWQASGFTGGEGDSPSPRAQGKMPAGSRGAGPGRHGGTGPCLGGQDSCPTGHLETRSWG